MGKNKKKFIDKKNASTYHLMHRSQRDVGGDLLAAGEEGEGMEVGNSGMILWPNPNNNPETDRKVLTGGKEEEDTMRAWRNKLSQAGLLDEYDEQYLKPITGQGTFLSANGKVSDASGTDPRAKEVAIRSSEELLGVAEVNAGELEHQFEGIGMAMELMDDDIQQALMGDFEEGDFEEILDDFVFEAAKEPDANSQEDAFDFDAHIAKLMDDARKQREDKPNLSMDQHDWATKDQDFFANSKPLRVVGEDYDDDDDSLFGNGHMTMTTSVLEVTPGVVPSLNPDEEKALCEQFERTLLEEYDSDEMGDILEEEIRGDRPLEGDAQVEAALEEYLQDKEDGFFMKGGENYHQEGTGTGNRGGGSGFSALVGTRMVPVKELDNDNDNTAAVVDATTPDEPFRPVSEVLKDAKKQIQSPELEPPPEEIFIDGKSYYSMKERNPWDCESILSTYSNLDNNPITIGASTISRKKKKKKQQQQQKIKLSSKTGLPVLNGNNNPVEEEEDEEYYDDDDDNEQTIISINRGVARKKKETPAEKRARKAQVKKERQMARIQKKVTKEVYKEEFINRAVVANTDGDVGNAGQAVFRYS